MECNDSEYLNLFKQINERPNITNKLMKETPDYSNYYSSPMLKETPDYSNCPNINEVRINNYSQEMNLNDFNIETRINGQNMNEVRREDKENRLNEVMQQMRQERLNEIKKTQELQNLNETVNFKDVDYVSLEMFEKARFNSMMQVANIILPK